LRTDFTLTEARVLFELGREDGLTATTLRERLKLDAGYLSRVLGRLDSISLLTREQSASDGRSQSVHLTGAGKTAYATLDQRRLLGSMAAIRELLGDPSVKDPFVLRALGPGDGGWVVQRHGELYAREYGWDETFEALVAGIVADHLEARNPRRERGWIAEVDGRRSGCLLCVEEDAATAKLRLLLVEPDARGLGIGGRLVAESLEFARGAGYERVALWTMTSSPRLAPSMSTRGSSWWRP
jgi:DNA-binding MarR family transcriptional regulator